MCWTWQACCSWLLPPLCFACQSDCIANIAFLVGVRVFAIGSSHVDLNTSDERMLPDLVTASLPINLPARSAEISAQLAQLAWHAASGAALTPTTVRKEEHEIA